MGHGMGEGVPILPGDTASAQQCGGCAGWAVLAPFLGTLLLTHSWNVLGSPGPEFPRGRAF